MLASPRGFSQLATSFFAYLRQGIHTHALSSLTIKLTQLSSISSLFSKKQTSKSRVSSSLPACQLPLTPPFIKPNPIAAIRTQFPERLSENCRRRRCRIFGFSAALQLVVARHYLFNFQISGEFYRFCDSNPISSPIGFRRTTGEITYIVLSTLFCFSTVSGFCETNPILVGLGRLELAYGQRPHRHVEALRLPPSLGVHPLR